MSDDTTTTDNTPPPNPSTPASPAEGPAPAAPDAKPPRKKTGVPSLRTPALEKQIFKALGEGLTFVYAAAMIGVTDRTLRNWMREDEEFASKCYHARAKTAGQITKALVDSAKNGDVKACTWLGERVDVINRELCKFNPEAVTSEKLAAVISRVVSLAMPFVPPDQVESFRAQIELVYQDLRPKEGDNDGR